MTSPLEIVNSYYHARGEGGDVGGVPLAEHVRFSGPLGSVEGAGELRADIAAKSGGMRCSVREQFVDDHRVCSIVDWQLSSPRYELTTTEILEVRNGEIVSGEVIFDRESIRNALSQAQGRTASVSAPDTKPQPASRHRSERDPR